MTTHPLQPTDTRLRLALLCLLLGVYLLVYVPEPLTADGDALLAAAASLARYGTPDNHAIAHGEWLLAPISRLGAPGADDALYTKKGPTPSLLLVPFVWLADALPWLTTRATAALFNPLVTTATALLLYTLTRRLGFRPLTAFLTALLYGVATFAITYVKTLFGEPLAALLVVRAVLSVVAYWQDGRARHLLLAGAALGLLVGVNTVEVVLVGVVGMLLLTPPPNPRLRGAGRRARSLIAFLIPLIIAGAGLLLYNWVRFGGPFESGYHFAAGEGFTRPIPLGLFGLFLSPYRGLFWYNPVLLLALPGWLMLRRHDARLAWLALALIAAQAVIFAGWWSWHGGIVWGPRFLIPVTPLLALCLAPLIDASLGHGRWLLRGVIAAFVVLSVGVQLLGALYSFYPYQFHLNVFYGTDVWDAPVTLLADDVLTHPGLSPIIGHVALWRLGWRMEPAWLSDGIDGVHLAAALAVLALGVGYASATNQSCRYRLIIPGVLILTALNGIVARQSHGAEFAAIREFERTIQPSATVVVLSNAFDETLVDVERGGRIITMNAPTDPTDPLASRLWAYARRQSGPLWLVTWFPPADPLNWQARDLWQNMAFVRETTLAGHRALWFDSAPSPPADQRSGVTFAGTLRLNAYGVRRDPDGVRVALEWSAARPPAVDYAWFVHLTDSTGAIIAQQDRPPHGGYTPTSAWSAGQPVVDRLFFPLEDGATGDWRVRLGWVNPFDGARLPAVATDGVALPDHAVTLAVE